MERNAIVTRIGDGSDPQAPYTLPFVSRQHSIMVHSGTTVSSSPSSTPSTGAASLRKSLHHMAGLGMAIGGALLVI